MRIGNFVIFEKIADIDALNKAALNVHHMLEVSNASYAEMYHERLKSVEYLIGVLNEKCNTEMKSIGQLLDGCKGLDARIKSLENGTVAAKNQNIVEHHCSARPGTDT